jgi:syntaxin 1B/2/3
MARQYRIVNPQATDEEIAAAVESGQTQVFSQAILNSSRSASANSVARAVRERQQDIQRIEKTLEELLVLFEQMEEQVVLAEPMVEQIEDKSHNAIQDLEHANTQLGMATKSARSWRKNKWICLGIGVLILAIIVIIIVIVVVLNQQKNKAV